MAATVLLAVGLFASTDIDNFVVLTAFYADRSYRTPQVTAGFLLGVSVIVAISAGGGAAAAAVPHRYVGLLGLVPLTLGVVKLRALRRGPQPAESETRGGSGRHRPLVVALVTVGNGGDNIAVFVPVFAASSVGNSVVIVAVFAVAAVVWCVAARLLARSARTGRVVSRVSHVVIPLVYLGLGTSILVFSGALGMLTPWG